VRNAASVERDKPALLPSGHCGSDGIKLVALLLLPCSQLHDAVANGDLDLLSVLVRVVSDTQYLHAFSSSEQGGNRPVGNDKTFLRTTHLEK